MVPLYCAIFVVSICISASITWLIRNFLNRYDWGSGTICSHHIHSRRIPRLGGLALFLSFFGILWGYLGLSHFLGFGALDTWGLKLLLPAACLFAVGLVDDLRGLTARTKLAGQIAGGICLYASGLRLFGGSLYFYPWVDAAFSLGATVFCVVLISNAMNLIDGLDGLAAGVALFSMVSILTLALTGGLTAIAVTTIILGGCVAGFLLFNFHPASIFLGDSGSLFLGCILSALVIDLSRRQGSVLNSALMPVFFFAVPLADTAVSMLRRMVRGRPLFEADREHLHHMLLKLGLSHRKAVWALYGIAAVCTLLSFVLLVSSQPLVISGTAALLLVFLFAVRKLGYREFAEISGIWRTVRFPQGDAEGYARPLNPRLQVVINRIRHRNFLAARTDVELEEPEAARVSGLPEVPAEEATR
jgi:UDP-GlcNAc:undecaprenyl-phosphate/decaprenyl-phosphate GlcNAc-1-phosphate transferase